MDQLQGCGGVGAQHGEVAQRAVAGDDVGRHLLPSRLLDAEGAQRLEQLEPGGVELFHRGFGSRATAATPLACAVG